MKPCLLFVVLACFGKFCAAQNVGIGTTTPEASAQLDVSSTQKGILFPRVTTAQRNAILSPAAGLMVFDTEKNLPYYFNGRKWTALGPIAANEVQPVESPGISTTYMEFGSSAAMAGSYAAVGIRGFDTAGLTNVGAVRLYQKTNSGWKPFQMIIPPDGANSDQFGASMDMQGDYLVVGAPGKTILTVSGAGKVYVYKLSTTLGEYVLEGQLTHPLGNGTNMNFGYSVTITNKSTITNGIAVAAGAPRYQINGVPLGTVSVFRRGNTGNYIFVNNISGIKSGEFFGYSIDMDADLLAVGAPLYDTIVGTATKESAGRVQMNVFNGSSYVFERTLAISPDTFTRMGFTVALDSNHVVYAGISHDDDTNGFIASLQRTGTNVYSSSQTFPDLHRLYETDVTKSIMGYKLAISKKLVLAGVPHSYSLITSFAQDLRPDYAVLFKKTFTPLRLTTYAQLKTPNLVATNSNFGIAVAASGSDYMICMPNTTGTDGDTFGSVFFGSIDE